MGRNKGRFTPLPTESEDPFGIGGITWQLDNVLLALEDASKRDDAREYASLAAQLAVVLSPKLTPDEYEDLSVPRLKDLSPEERRRMKKREVRRDYDRRLFIASRLNVARMLRLASERGIYAKKDESPPEIHDGKGLALEG